MLDIFDLIAQVETGRNFEAMRFEDGVYARIVANRTDAQKVIIANIIKANGGQFGCSWHTALMIFSTSFGAAQIMGFNLYGRVCGFPGSVIDFMRPGQGAIVNVIAESCQRVIFSHLLQSMNLGGATPENLAGSAAGRKAFAVDYNGSPAYADAIILALEHFQIPVIK